MLDVLLPSLLLALLFAALRHAPRLLARPTRHAPPIAYRLPRRAEWSLERQGLTLSATTSAFNGVPKRLVQGLDRPGGPKGRPLLRRFYDLGVVVGCAGSATALGGAIWALTRAWGAVWDEAEAHVRVQAASKVKRAVAQLHGTGGGGLEPLIPGVTTPLSHLPTLLLALVLSQLIHELGHALAAAIEDVSPSKLAFSVHAIVPSASVVFPSSIDFLSVRARARIATSGPWHNLLLVGALMAVGWLSPLVWTDVSSQGRMVQSVQQGSNLAISVRVGDIITHIDDEPLNGREDKWDSYLSTMHLADPNRGWCISELDFEEATKAPCDSWHLIAFTKTPTERTGAVSKCLTPHAVMIGPSGDCNCRLSDICVRPAPYERILRLQVRSGKREDTVIWSGDRTVLRDQIKLGTSKPRLLPSMVRWGTLFITYLKMASLSLFLFNLLPLPSTDGIQLLSALLSQPSGHYSRPARQLTAQPASRHPTINPYRYESGSEDEEDDYGEHPGWATAHGRREHVWQRRLRRVVEGATAAVVAGWVLGWGMLALLRSS